MSEEQLTVEKIKSVSGYVNSEEIGFLLSHIKLIEGLLEVEQEDCEQVRKNKELNWQRAIVAEAKLATIERDTAEKCCEMIELQQDKIKHTSHRDGLGMGCLCCEGQLASMSNDITDKFNLGEKP